MTHDLSAQLLGAFQRRHACHLFEADKALTQEQLDFILEAGRLSPSSFGLEQWKFLVLTSAAQKAAMQAACFNQPQVGSAGALVVILAKLAELHPDHPYAQKLLRREYPGEAFAPALKNYRGFHAATDIKAWSASQCHIAAANMMTAATALGIDSCAIGGFLPEQVRGLLGINPAQYEVALVLALGTCAQPPGEKQRLPLAELVEYR
ncbi:MAG: NAD(P)H-dependent oxidoreductase [Pseudomonadota bacterium]